jgi:hypothetical protein
MISPLSLAPDFSQSISVRPTIRCTRSAASKPRMTHRPGSPKLGILLRPIYEHLCSPAGIQPCLAAVAGSRARAISLRMRRKLVQAVLNTASDSTGPYISHPRACSSRALSDPRIAGACMPITLFLEGLCCTEVRHERVQTQYPLPYLIFKRYGHSSGVRTPASGSGQRCDGNLGRLGLVGAGSKRITTRLHRRSCPLTTLSIIGKDLLKGWIVVVGTSNSPPESRAT